MVVVFRAFVELEEEALIDAGLTRAAEGTSLEPLATKVHVDVEEGCLRLAGHCELVARIQTRVDC